MKASNVLTIGSVLLSLAVSPALADNKSTMKPLSMDICSFAVTRRAANGDERQLACRLSRGVDSLRISY